MQYVHACVCARICTRMLLCVLLCISRCCHVLIEQPRSSLMPYFPLLMKIVELLKQKTKVKWDAVNLCCAQAFIYNTVCTFALDVWWVVFHVFFVLEVLNTHEIIPILSLDPESAAKLDGILGTRHSETFSVFRYMVASSAIVVGAHGFWSRCLGPKVYHYHMLVCSLWCYNF